MVGDDNKVDISSILKSLHDVADDVAVESIDRLTVLTKMGEEQGYKNR